MTQDISIHAPLAGCDQSERPTCKRFLNFYPRTPSGVRLRPAALALGMLHFYPRTPSGVRRLVVPMLLRPVKFLSTHP